MRPRTSTIPRSSLPRASRSAKKRWPWKGLTSANSPNRSCSRPVETKPLIGVLALQGDVVEHAAAMRRAGADAIPVKTAAELERVDGLIIPGGESTTVMKLLDRFALAEPIVRRVKNGMPLWGTCMGMIVV